MTIDEIKKHNSQYYNEDDRLIWQSRDVLKIDGVRVPTYIYMGVMNGEMTFCDVSFKGGMLYYVTKEDIDNGDVEEEIRIFEIKDKEDYHLK